MSAPSIGDRTGEREIGPMGLRDLGRCAAGVIRRSPLATVGVIAVVSLTVAALGIAARMPLTVAHTSGFRTDSESRQVLVSLGLWPGGAIVASLLWMSVALCSFGMIAVVVARSFVGHGTSVREAWRVTRPRLLALVGLGLGDAALLLMPVVVCAALAISIADVIGPDEAGAVALVLTGVAIFGILALVPTVVLAPQAVILERRGPLSAISRAITLQRHGFWRLFALITTVNLGSFAVGSVLALPFTVAALVANPGDPTIGEQTLTSLTLAAAGWVLGQILTLPFAMAFYSALYTDQRVRYEGFGEVLQAQAEGGPSDIPVEEIWGAEPRVRE